MPGERLFYEGLGPGRTVVRYDRPGCGLSGATDREDVVELELEVILAVAEAVGAERFDLIGTSFGAPLAAKFAADHPDRVDRLVLYGGWVEGAAVAAPAVRQHILGLVEQHWGFASDVLTEIFAPDADPGFRATFSTYQRESASPGTARRLLAACYEIDVGDDLARIRAKTTVIHREDDRAAPLAEGQRLADGIAGATMRVLPGRTHVPFVGDVESLLAEIRAALGLAAVRRRRAAVLTPRQSEVAELVAQGMSNRQIAETLVITERSAESHVERIRLRMGFRSRAQIAAWYAATHPHAELRYFHG
jgi:pimeloyl-ACP methyl ester carboxylesterase/DNA-binding CsgD family transcriptional regulator